MKPLQKLYTRLAGAMGIVGISLFFLVFSCTQKLPTAPQNTVLVSPLQAGPAAPPNGNPVTVVTFNPGGVDTASTKAGTTVFRAVGYNGDTIAFPIGDKDTAYLICPRGAVKSGTNVTLNLKGNFVLTNDGAMSASMYNFLPHGFVFEKDCYLIQPARFPNGTQLELSWRNPSSGQWVLENVSTVSNGRVIFKIRHFSDYGAPLEALSSGGQNAADDGVN